MTGQYDFGMIGLGVMGSNLLLNMADNGFAAIGFDLKPERGRALEAAATEGTVVKGVNSLSDLVKALKRPRKLMMLVPAGQPVDDVIESLLPLLEPGDILIDGGNSFFRDTLRRVTYLQEKGLHFMGMGVSGGEFGARRGPSLMPGGDREAYDYLRPILEAISAKADGIPCVGYMGSGAAGHYVKMVHNGIEYAMMQLISEAYDLMHRGTGFTNDELYTTFKQWNKGPLQSFLINITAEIFKTKEPETHHYLVDVILDQAGSKGTGKWTSQEAMNLPVAIPTIDAAVAARNLSVFKEQRTQAARLFGTDIRKVQIPKKVLAADLEQALYFSFMMAYTQGLAMLAAASDELNMDIPLADVVNVWKSGCIIRSTMLADFSEAYRAQPGLPNLMLDRALNERMQETEEATRRITTLAIGSRVPVAAFSSALSYYDAVRSERLPTNLIQAQRDYFGAHTYRRIDREGVFHTEWHANAE